MITQNEFADMMKIANDDEGLRDLLLRAKEYYLLKRTKEPAPVRTAADIPAAIRARSINK